MQCSLVREECPPYIPGSLEFTPVWSLEDFLHVIGKIDKYTSPNLNFQLCGANLIITSPLFFCDLTTWTSATLCQSDWQAWAGIPVPKFFPKLFSQFFPNLGWEHCFLHSTSQLQKVGTVFFTPNPKIWENFFFKFPLLIPNFLKIYWEFYQEMR